MAKASDAFTSNSDPLASPWTNCDTGLTGFEALSGVCKPKSPSAQCTAYTGISTPETDYAEVKIVTAATNTDEGAGPACRITRASGNALFMQGGGDTRVYGHTGTNWGANFTQYGTTGAAAVSGDLLRMWVVTSGSDVVVHATKNGTDICGSPITITGGNTNFGSGECGVWAAGGLTYTVDDYLEDAIGGANTAALTGTATSSITEADVVTGGKTVILTLTGDTFVAAAGTPTYNAATTKGTTAADSAGGGGARTGDGTLTCTFPSGYTPTAGHFAVMAVYSDQGSGSTPTDWSNVTGSPFGAGTEKLNLFYKVLAGGEGSPATTISGSTTNMSHCANMVIYTGVGAIGAIGTASNGTGTPMTAAGITTTANNSIVCAFSGRGDNETSSGQTFNASSTGVVERLDGGTAAGNDSQVSMADKTYASSGTATGALASTTSVTDPWVSVFIELVPSTPFADARAAIRNGLDSAQAEAAGWDAKVKPNIPVASVVRTSDTVCTITLQAQSDYDITATETITATIPAAAVQGAGAITATPTFTVVTAGAATALPKRPTILNQAVNRAANY